MKSEYPCAILIPVYKEYIDRYEELSFRRCLKILNKYKIILVTYESLDLSVYEGIANEYQAQLGKMFFSKDYFSGIAGYNKLMKSKQFYQSFDTFEYILIYQLDAFVFRDELEFWCKQGYDYIGAPWFSEFGEKKDASDLWRVGNGGFSLRRVPYFIKVLSRKLPLMKYKWVISMNNINLLKKPFYMLGWRNNIDYYVKTEQEMNEDIFFSLLLHNSYVSPVLPDVEVAALFAFDKSPSWLYNFVGNKLPFGCHAFRKNEFDEFWKPFIDNDEIVSYNS